MIPDDLGRWEQPGECRAHCCFSDYTAGTQAFQAGGFALCCCRPCIFGYETRLCLSTGRAAVHLFFPFARVPSKQIPIQAFKSHKKGTFSSVEKGGGRRSMFWCGVRGSADGQWEHEAAVRGYGGLEQTPDPAACAGQSSGEESPWGSGSGGDAQDLIGIAVSLTLQASVAALL